ncbi:ribosomal protein S18-alanine N-acetyltransferase [Pelomonas sp. KK5]|uniref:ribosomal protein S18-alanine N-acetyltransferase n=1 Tax=Pelomonas sp. KK5 TaxID=1855730 RepID=UPI00097BE1B6|nr:ribosomal protein S18-alanine N-acetyltransferase [Pelomonas sp. KK5]
MSAIAPERPATGEPRLVPMHSRDVPEIMAIETRAYATPWTPGNFVDSLAAGYLAFVLREPDSAELTGYFLAMKGAGEMHLLNITVAPEREGQGLARLMLDRLCAMCREQGCEQLWLEVRVGNARARRVYQRYGFAEVGLRKRYYPTASGPREDAVLMSLAVPA